MRRHFLPQPSLRTIRIAEKPLDKLSVSSRASARDGATGDFAVLSLWVSGFLAGGYLLFWRPILQHWVF